MALCPIRYHFANVGLDPSWAVALNYFHTKSIVFGRDTAFTYGPLGYLILPMPFGSNLGQGILFQSAAWILLVALLSWLVIWKKLPLYRVAIFTVCAIPGADMFYEFGYAGPDFFLVLLVLVLLGVSVVEKRWQISYLSATGLTVVLLFIKISTGISAIAGLLLLPMALLLFDRARAVRMALTAVIATPMLFVAGYLVYEPSLGSLSRYVRSAMDISSSYSTAMSQPGGDRELINAVLMLAAYGLMALALLWTRQSSFCLAFAGAGSLFLEFKHSFVRPPGHTEIVFTFLPPLLALVLLSTDFTRRPRWPVPFALVLLVGAWYSQESGRLSLAHLRFADFGLRNAMDAAKSIDFPALRRTLEDASRTNLAPGRLPSELLSRISGKTVGIFPWEASYAAANVIDYRPLPIFQTYAASTPFLDEWNADFLNNLARAPQFLVFEWDSIDGRHPLLDVPATSIAMFRQYEFDSSYGARLLLRKRARPLDGTARLVRSETIAFGQPLRLPESGHPLFARARLRLSPLGQLRKFLLRIPEIDVILSSAAMRSLVARVPPEVMPDGIPVNFLPSSLERARMLFEARSVEAPFSELVFFGPGANDFENPFQADVYEMPGINLSTKNAPAPDLSATRYLGALDTARLESLNNTSAVEIPERETMELGGKPAMLVVQGWAFDSFAHTPAAAVFIEMDGKLYPANYGTPRLDVAALFKSRGLAATGFQWSMPAWKLGTATHEISVKVLASDGKGYYDVSKKNRFRIVN